MPYKDTKLYKKTYARARRQGYSRKRSKACAKSAVYRSRQKRGWMYW